MLLLPSINLFKALITPQHRFMLMVAVFIMISGNNEFFHYLTQVYPLADNYLFLASVTVFFTLITTLLLNFICYGRLTPFILALMVVLVSLAAYFMDRYGVVIDINMLDNVAQTNMKEASELFSMGFIWRITLFGVLPAWIILKYCPQARGIKAELISKGVVAVILVLLMISVAAPFASAYASFIREHKSLRFYTNPGFFSYSLIKYLKGSINPPASKTLLNVAADAKLIGSSKKTELIIVVVGEAARADHFSLNGYDRETNPELKKLDVVSLKNVTSCGTSTAISVPCMFSPLGRKSFDVLKGLHYKNVLDVLSPKVEVLWRDNNSDSKGVATRVTYENFRDASLNPVCEGECRDIGMLSGLDGYINAMKGKDLLIVLHQMGNHGPAYYRRYPPDFEKFTPACKSDDLGKCSDPQIINAYDNAILYTDYFLSEVIALLKRHDDAFEAGMLYVADHGESLGEYGVYLHGAPYAIAPQAQTHIPAILWMGKGFDYRADQLKPYENHPFSHDDLFCTLLTAFEVDSSACAGWRPILKQSINQDSAHE